MSNSYAWYAQLVKPAFAPPSWVFGPVWTLLYAVIFLSYGTVFYQVATRKLPPLIALPFVLNLLFNIAFTPLQFGLKNNALASIDILLILATLLWALWTIYPHLKWVTWVNIPYLIWVCFATVLQLSITYLNR